MILAYETGLWYYEELLDISGSSRLHLYPSHREFCISDRSLVVRYCSVQTRIKILPKTSTGDEDLTAKRAAQWCLFFRPVVYISLYWMASSMCVAWYRPNSLSNGGLAFWTASLLKHASPRLSVGSTKWVGDKKTITKVCKQGTFIINSNEEAHFEIISDHLQSKVVTCSLHLKPLNETCSTIRKCTASGKRIPQLANCQASL